MKSKLLKSFFDKVNGWSEQIAIIDQNNQSYTFNQLLKSTVFSQQVLNQKKVKKGQIAIVAVPMSFELYPILYALLTKGITAVFLDPWFSRKQMNQLIGELNPSIIIVDHQFKWLLALLPQSWFTSKWIVKGLGEKDPPLEIEDMDESDTALVTYTSGSSGKPKGANRTYAFLEAQINALTGYLKREQSTRDYTNFPIVGLGTLYFGNTLVIPKIKLKSIDQANPVSIINQVKESNASRLIVSPAILEKANTRRLASIHEIITGGSPLLENVAKKTLDLYDDITLTNLYGSTESEPIASTDFNAFVENFNQPEKGLLAGKVYSLTQLKIVAINDPSIELQEEEIGEIIVTGNHVNKSYFRNQQAFHENKIEDSKGEVWHRTKDTGYLKNGLLYLVGTVSRTIHHSGQAYHPFIVENQIRQIFGITDLAYYQKEGQVYLKYHSSQTSNEKLQNWLMESQYPIDVIVATDEPLPKDPRHRGKIDIKAL